jgi:hypothetical protein
VVPGLVSLAQTPRPFPPFGLPPSCSREGGGSSQGLCSFLEEVPRLLSLHPFPCRGSNSSPPPKERTTITSTRRWRPYWPREPSKRYPSSVLHQPHFSRPQERWQHESHPQPQEVERRLSGYSTLPDGDGAGCLPCSPAGRLGDIHRPQRHLLPCSSTPVDMQVHEVWLEGQTLPVPGPTHRPVPSPQSLHVHHQGYQGDFHFQASPGGLHPPPFLFWACG